MEHPCITCPVCMWTSYSPQDVLHGWCGNCQAQTSRVPQEEPCVCDTAFTCLADHELYPYRCTTCDQPLREPHNPLTVHKVDPQGRPHCPPPIGLSRRVPRTLHIAVPAAGRTPPPPE